MLDTTEDKEEEGNLMVKWCGSFHSCRIMRSPLDIVAWHGNYAPWKYDLRNFSPVIYTLLSDNKNYLQATPKEKTY